MPARILKTSDVPAAVVLNEAVSALLDGLLVVVPTETVYGLAGLDDSAAMDLIYSAKTRDRGKPLPLMAAEVSQLGRCGFVMNEMEEKLASAFWPGPMTLVLNRGEVSEGVRVPEHALVRRIIAGSGGILRVTSANQSGEPPALNAQMAVSSLGAKAALIIDDGPCNGGIPSTVVKCSNWSFDILREGAISQHSIADILKVL